MHSENVQTETELWEDEGEEHSMRILTELNASHLEPSLEGLRRTFELKDIGHGYCPDGYLGGWDGKYLAEDECNQACANSVICQAVSFCPPGEALCQHGTCSRYSAPCTSGNLLAADAAAKAHTTFAKPAYKVVTAEKDYDLNGENSKSAQRAVEYVRAGAKKKNSNYKVAVLSMLGSYAPLTKGHLNAFILTRQTLLTKGFDLVVGVMSMNPEGHVAAKLKAKGQANVPFEKRHELANCAFEDAGTDWMFTEKGQTQLFGKLKRELRDEKVDFQLFFMNGADDVYAGRKYLDCGKTFPDGRKFVMVGRPGDTDKVQVELKKRGISGNDLDCLWIDNAGGYSSSMLRSAAMKSEWDKVWEVSDRCVAAFMSGPWMGKAPEMSWIEPKMASEGATAGAAATAEAPEPTMAPMPTAPEPASAPEPAQKSTELKWVQFGGQRTVCDGWTHKVKSEEECRKKAQKKGRQYYSFSTHKGGRCKYQKTCNLRSNTDYDWVTYKWGTEGK